MKSSLGHNEEFARHLLDYRFSVLLTTSHMAHTDAAIEGVQRMAMASRRTLTIAVSRKPVLSWHSSVSGEPVGVR